MIKLITILLFIITNLYCMPEYLKGATISVTLKTGEVYEFKSEDYKVVPRDVVTILPIREIVVIKRQNRNRVNFHVGYGRNGLIAEVNSNNVTVTQSYGPVVGASYDRYINDNISLGITGLNNSTYLFNLGFDF